MSGKTFDAMAWGDRITGEQLDELLERAEKSHTVLLRIDQFRDLVRQAKEQPSADSYIVPAELLRRARNMCLRSISSEYDEAKRIVAELDALPSGSQSATASLWSIRHVDGRWRTMDTLGMPDWTDDPKEALAVMLREHADAYAADDPDDVRIVPWSAS